MFVGGDGIARLAVATEPTATATTTVLSTSSAVFAATPSATAMLAQQSPPVAAHA